MDELVKSLTGLWCKNPAATYDEIVAFEEGINFSLPIDFKEFLLWSNGGEGKFRNIYISLWSLNDISTLNHDYGIETYLGDRFIAIGSDGGPICFLLDLRDVSSVKIVSVNFGDLDPEEINLISTSFQGFLELAISGELKDDDL